MAKFNKVKRGNSQENSSTAFETTIRKNSRTKFRGIITWGIFAISLALFASGGFFANLPLAHAATSSTTDDKFQFQKNQPVTIKVLNNDNFGTKYDDLRISQIDSQNVNPGDEITITGGKLTLNADWTVTFTPDANFTGSPQFSYTVAWANIISEQTEDFEDATPGVHTHGLHTKVIADDSAAASDWGVKAGIGVDGSQGFFGGWVLASGADDMTAHPVVFPEVFNINDLNPNEEINISAMMTVGTPDCPAPGTTAAAIASRGACNEAYVGFISANSTNAGADSDGGMSIGVVYANNKPGYATRLIAEAHLSDGGVQCTALGATFNAQLNRCYYSNYTGVTGSGPSGAEGDIFPNKDGEYFKLSASLWLDSQNHLRGTYYYNDTALARDMDFGDVSTRPWLENFQLTFNVDDFGDNGIASIREQKSSSANVVGTFYDPTKTPAPTASPRPGVPATAAVATSSIFAILAVGLATLLISRKLTAKKSAKVRK